MVLDTLPMWTPYTTADCRTGLLSKYAFFRWIWVSIQFSCILWGHFPEYGAPDWNCEHVMARIYWYILNYVQEKNRKIRLDTKSIIWFCKWFATFTFETATEGILTKINNWSLDPRSLVYNLLLYILRRRKRLHISSENS